MVMDPVSRVSASSLAAATVLAVTNIDSPATELNARAGGTNGALCIVTQNVVGINEWTIYCFDAASSGSVNSPYVVAALTSGQWIAVAGKYVNSALNVTGAITGVSTVQGTRIISTIATGTAPFTVASTTNVPNLNASSLAGATFAAPGPIGSGTPGTGAFTTLAASGAVTLTATTASTTRATGTVVIGSGGSGGLGVGGAVNAASIKFADAGTTLANYEEGTWTPSIIGTTTPGTHTYNERTGRYTRIGRFVFASCNVSLSVKDGTMAGNIRISGLPFTVNGALDYAACVSNVNGITFGGGIVARAIGTITAAGLGKLTSGGSAADVTDADVGATPRVYMTALYEV